MGDGLEIPVSIRVHLAHAAVEAVARSLALRVLHIKGPALDVSLSSDRGGSTDADVLVGFADAVRMRAAMVAAGWREITDFATGSAFEHAATLHHDYWGYVDLHRSFPGLSATAFDDMWRRRATTEIASIECFVPDLDAQRVILLAHYARGGRYRDLETAWNALDNAGRVTVRRRACELGAEVALAAAIGELDQHPDSKDADLWRSFGSGSNRADEWRGRWRAASGVRAKGRVLGRMVRLNRDHLRMELGHEPGPREVRAAWRRRAGRAVSSLRDRR